MDASRFKDIKPFEKITWFSFPTMHEMNTSGCGAINTNWVSTVGANINEVECISLEKVDCRYAVALNCRKKQLKVGYGSLEGNKAFYSYIAFDATVN